MRMIINNMKFGDFDFFADGCGVDIYTMIREKLNAANILYSVKMVEKTIQFDFIPGKEPKRLFLYAKHNKLPLKPGDPRIKTTKRDYLLSHRLTEAQVKTVWEDIINTSLDNLGVSCNIIIQEFPEDPTASTVIREGFVWGEWKFKDKKYPVEA